MKKLTRIIAIFSIFLFFPNGFAEAKSNNQVDQSIVEKNTNRLGHIKSSKVKIYSNLRLKSSKKAGTTFTNQAYYIKKKAAVKGQTYFLISKKPSSTTGVVGWVNSKDMSTKKRTVVDKKKKTFYIKGTGSAYSKPWGGKKEYVYPDLKKYSNQKMIVDITEKIGDDTWYRGTLKGKTAWIKSSYVKKTKNLSTKYDLTLSEAVDIQMTRSPQTDKYRNQNAFIYKGLVNKETSGVTVEEAELRKTPKLEAKIETTIKKPTRVIILESKNGEAVNGNKKWYKITYNKEELYVHSSSIERVETTFTTTDTANIRESASNDAHIFATLRKGTKVNVIKEGTWHEIKYGEMWRNAKRADVELYLNPANNSKYQHLLLSSTAGVSASQLNKVLKGKGTLDGLGSAFIEGGKKHKVNEIYLISHALLETGHGTSKLAQGIEVGKDKGGNPVLATSKNKKDLTAVKKVYNMFGIKAFDSCPDTCGAVHAYEQGWDSPSKAVIGGAEFIGQQYIHNQYKQNTIYKMRWNFTNPSKQYATDVGWAVKQTARIESLYAQLDNPNLVFDIPKFK